MRDERGRVRVRRRAHAGFVRKEAAGDAEANRFFHRDAQETAAKRLRVECAHNDMLKHRQDFSRIEEQNHQRAQNVNHRHQRYDELREMRDPMNAADED